MNKNIILFYTRRDGYAPSQCGTTLTAGELIKILQRYDENTLIYYSNDRGYTYGALDEDYIEEVNGEELE